MTFSALLTDLLWPLVVFGVPLVLFAAIGRASWPVRERTPLSRWGWADVYSNFRRGLRISAENTPLGRLMDDTVEPRPQDPDHPPRTSRD